MVKSVSHAEPKNFESAIQALEAIVREMEGSTLPLEDSMSRYQRGLELVRYCETTLTAAEQRIRVLESGQLQALNPTSVDHHV
jgi:exodeoxyribonuclease VII small subunit